MLTGIRTNDYDATMLPKTSLKMKAFLLNKADVVTKEFIVKINSLILRDFGNSSKKPRSERLELTNNIFGWTSSR